MATADLSDENRAADNTDFAKLVIYKDVPDIFISDLMRIKEELKENKS